MKLGYPRINIKVSLSNNTYCNYTFIAPKKDSYENLKKIIENTEQVYINNDDMCCKEVDFENLCNNLFIKYNIYLLIPIEDGKE